MYIVHQCQEVFSQRARRLTRARKTLDYYISWLSLHLARRSLVATQLLIAASETNFLAQDVVRNALSRKELSTMQRKPIIFFAVIILMMLPPSLRAQRIQPIQQSSLQADSTIKQEKDQLRKSRGDTAKASLPKINFRQESVKVDLKQEFSLRQEKFLQFNSKYENQWRVQWNAKTGLINKLFGYHTEPSTLKSENVVSSFLEDHSDLLGVDTRNLQLETVQAVRSRTIVKFRQLNQGIPVYNGQVKSLLSERGEILSIDFQYFPVPEISTIPAIGTENAISISKNKASSESKSKPLEKFQVVGDPKLAIFPKEKETGYDYRLVWIVSISSTESAYAKMFFVDASSGEIIYIQNLIKDIGILLDKQNQTKTDTLYSSRPQKVGTFPSQSPQVLSEPMQEPGIIQKDLYEVQIITRDKIEKETLLKKLGTWELKGTLDTEKPSAQVLLELTESQLNELRNSGYQLNVLRNARLIEHISSSARESAGPNQVLAYQYGENSTNVSIPDNNSNWTANSQISISGAPSGSTVTTIDVHFEVIHPLVGDLELVLNNNDNAAGVWMWQREGGSADNISRTYTGLTNFQGNRVNENWALWARDLAAGDAGYIDYWWIKVYYTSGFASVSQGVTVTPSPVVLGNNFSGSFTLRETQGASITFESIVCAILKSDNSHLVDMEVKGPITISANGTYSYSSTQQWRLTDPPGNYKAVARGKVADGTWFDFSTTGSGVNSVPFSVVSSNFSVSGTILGQRYQVHYYDSPGLASMPDMQVYIKKNTARIQGPFTTSSGGYFSTPSISSTSDRYYVEALTEGTWAKVMDMHNTTAGGDVFIQTKDLGTSPSGNVNGDMNFNGDTFTNVYYHINLIHNYVKGTLGFNGMDFKMNVYLNYADPDGIGPYYQALWDDIHFPAWDTRYAKESDVIYHEYAHGIQDKAYGGLDAGPDESGMGEGISDYFAATLNNDPLIDMVGRQLDQGGNPRRYDNQQVLSTSDYRAGLGRADAYWVLPWWEPPSNDNDGGYDHHNAAVSSGALWDMRQNLGNGTLANQLVMEALLIGPENHNDLYNDLLVADDNDGNLGNGTPHFTQITTAFSRHGITSNPFNLVANFTPQGWDYPIVPSSQSGTHTVNTLYGGTPTYIDIAVANLTYYNVTTPFKTYLYIDNVAVAEMNSDAGLPARTMVKAEDYSRIIGDGYHTLKIYVDVNNSVSEFNENDNTYERQFYWNPTAPTAPTNLTASVASSSQINLTWQDNATNETGYKVERKTGASGTYSEIASLSAGLTSYNNTGLTDGTQYYYRVYAYNSAGNSGYSNEANATTPVALPTAPTSLSTSVISSSQINLSWQDNATNETGYKVERKTGASGTYAEIASLSAGSTSYNNTGLTDGTQYYYRVRAYNSAGNSNYSNESNGTTPMNAPTSLTATAASSTQINLSWQDNSGSESGYRIERKTGVSGTYSEIATVGTNVSTYNNTGLTENTTYYYRVRGYNSLVNSDYSNEANASTITSVEQISQGIPDHYFLSQNFPNPFNPTTNVRFGLPRTSTVDIVIYNILGQVVCTPFERYTLSQGSYNFNWLGLTDYGAPLPSGVYILRISAEPVEHDSQAFSEVRKLLMIK